MREESDYTEMARVSFLFYCGGRPHVMQILTQFLGTIFRENRGASEEIETEYSEKMIFSRKHVMYFIK